MNGHPFIFKVSSLQLIIKSNPKDFILMRIKTILPDQFLDVVYLMSVEVCGCELPEGTLDLKSNILKPVMKKTFCKEPRL